MEIMVRLAKDKYIKNGACQNVTDATKMLYNDCLKQLFCKFDCHLWRKNILWCEENDLVYKRMFRAVTSLYEKYSGKYALPGAVKYMSLDEFITLVTDAGVVNENFGAREISPLFNLSMMT